MSKSLSLRASESFSEGNCFADAFAKQGDRYMVAFMSVLKMD